MLYDLLLLFCLFAFAFSARHVFDVLELRNARLMGSFLFLLMINLLLCRLLIVRVLVYLLVLLLLFSVFVACVLWSVKET